MKLILTLVFTIFTAPELAAQIPNTDFENWTASPGYESPNGWGTVANVTDGVAVTCEKSTDAHSGSFSAKLFTADLGFLRAPGVVVTGVIDLFTNGAIGGFPYSQRPAALTGFYKYSPDAGDSCVVFGFLSRYDAQGDSAEVVGLFFWQGAAATNWSSFTAPIAYLSAAVPDTGQISISASLDFSNPGLQSVMFVDDIAFSGSVSAPEIPRHASVYIQIAPNPVVDELRLHFDSPEPVQLLLVNASGQLLRSQVVLSGASIGVADFDTGIYQVFLLTRDGGQLLGQRRFIKQ